MATRMRDDNQERAFNKCDDAYMHLDVGQWGGGDLKNVALFTQVGSQHRELEQCTARSPGPFASIIALLILLAE